MTNAKVQRIRQHYQRRVSSERETYDILDWGTRQSQIARFRVLHAVLDTEGGLGGKTPPHLLDVGCGMSDLADYFQAAGVPVRYVGIDITLAVVREAVRRFPGRDLLLGDVFSAPPFAGGTFDVAYCSGVFNLKLGNNQEFAVNAVRALVPLTRRLVVANFLHERTATKYLHCHYYDPQSLVSALHENGLRVSLIDDYLENDFTLVVRAADDD